MQVSHSSTVNHPRKASHGELSNPTSPSEPVLPRNPGKESESSLIRTPYQKSESFERSKPWKTSEPKIKETRYD